MSSHPSAVSMPASAYDFLLVPESADARTLRRTLVAALVVHAVVLSLTVPQLVKESAPPKPEERVVIRLGATPRFEEKPVPQTQVAIRPTVKPIPMPDPTPDDPDPLPAPEVIVPVPVDVVVIPAAPPAPPAPPAPDPVVEDEPTLVRLGANMARPSRIHFVEPRYTEAARRIKVQGAVILDAVIDENGVVKDIKVLKSLGFGLTDAAVDAVSQWRYEPTRINGRPVAVAFSLTVTFQVS